MNFSFRNTARLVQALFLSAALLLCRQALAAPPRVVASTSWVAAFAKAAGIADVALVAPANLQHPPDYDPKPSDLAAIAKADFVLAAGFEGFASRMKEASGSRAEVVYFHVDNQPENIKKQVMLLAEKFGTQAAARAWIARFDKRLAELRQEITTAMPQPAPRAVAQMWMAYWVPFAHMELAGTYGPKPVTASELAKLAAIKPDFIIINAHTQGRNLFDDFAAKQIVLYNFPPDNNIDLLAIFERNAQAIIQAVKK